MLLVTILVISWTPSGGTGAEDGMPRTRGPTVEEYRKHRRLVLLGKVLMGVAALVAVVHLGVHLTGSPSGLVDIAAGYPAAGAVFIIGGVLAGRAEPGPRA